MSYKKFMQNNNYQNKIWLLIARSLSEEISDAEQRELILLLQQDAILQQQYDVLKNAWRNSQEPVDEVNELEKKKIKEILSLAAAKEQTGSLKRVWAFNLKYKIAAAAILLIAFTATWWFVTADRQAKDETVNNTSKNIQTLATNNASRTHILLPDGSAVWLNAGSKIFYDHDFKGNLREVTLEGEAYFDVIKQPEKPFIVHVSGYDIKVLGTAFNVKSYPTDKTIQTVLLRGLIQMTKQGDEKQEPYFLHPNEKLIIDKTENISLTGDNTGQAKLNDKHAHLLKLDTLLQEAERAETAWMYNRLVFRGDNFEELAGKMERWYNVNIVFEDEDVKNLSFTGSFENETVAQAFEALKTATPFTFWVNGQKIFVRSK